MRRLIEEGKVEIREIDELHRELAVLVRGLLQPLRDDGAKDPPRRDGSSR